MKNNNKNITAVNWLNSELERLSNQVGVNLSWAIVNDLIAQARVIEREQIKLAYESGSMELLDSETYFNLYLNEKQNNPSL